MKETTGQDPMSSKNIENIEWKQRNKDYKYISRRGFIDHKSMDQGTRANNAVKIGRNDPCHCGSGVKFKNCHLVKQVIKKQ